MRKTEKVNSPQTTVNCKQSISCGQWFLGKVFVCAIILNLLILSYNSFSQNTGVSINITGALPNSKALLDVDATGMSPKAGVLIPRMSTADRNAITGTIPESLLIYNTDTHCFEAYYNGGWVGFGCLNNSCPVPSAPTAGINTPSTTQITWNWNAVAGATGYKWNVAPTYGSATDNVTNTSYIQSGLNCNTSNTLYVWAYNTCGNSTYTSLTQTSSICSFSCGGVLEDTRDGQTYTTVLIGSQCWMSQNLNYGTYGVRTACPNGCQPLGYKFCQNLSGVADPTCPMGGLYEFGAMVQFLNGESDTTSWNPVPTGNVQGVCPNAWHIPTNGEWTTLTNYLSANSTYWCGGNNTQIAKSLASTSGWTPYTFSATYTECYVGYNQSSNNSSGFNAFPAGNTWNNAPYLISASNSALYWSATENGQYNATYRYMNYDSPTVHPTTYSKGFGYSVRCVKD